MFEFDNAIESPKNDELGNRTFAFHLAENIVDLKDIQQSFVIGICGKWGEGKTSIINMVLTYLNHLYIEKRSMFDIDNIINENITNNTKQKNKIVITILLEVIIYFTFLYLLILYITNFADKYLIDYDIWKFLFKWFCYFAIPFFFLEKYMIPLCQLLSKKVKIKQPFTKIKNYFFPSKNEKPLIIRFEPWNYNSSEEILNQFFKVLTNKLHTSDNECYYNIEKLITVYAKTFLNIDLNFLDNIFFDKNFIDIKSKIETELKKCNNQKIIIVIDDIDRLLPNEILTIFKTVKIIANFSNLVYILSFDKEKVIDILENEYKFDACDYIKKIIQVEKHIPPIENDVLKKQFIEKLYKIPDIIKQDFSEEYISRLYDFALAEKYITNIRDLIRFFNTFEFTYSSYKDEYINLNDLIAITAVEVFEPKLYNYIKENKHIFCSYNVGIYISKEGIIYTNNKYNKYNKYNNSISIIKFFDEIKSFNNIKIIQVLFPLLFISIRNNINNYRPINNSGEKISDDLKKIADSIDSDIEFFKTEESYRRVYDISCFENYFRINFDRNTLTNNHINNLFSSINDTILFKTKLNELYEENHNKVIDFLNYWESKYNKGNRNKDNTVNLIKNFISIDNMDLIDFLELHYNNFAYILSNLIINYNQEKQNSIISVKDIYNVFKSQKENMKYNCFNFIYIICRLYKFPIIDPPENKLSNEDKKNLKKCIKLIRGNITIEAVYNSKNGCKCLNYLYKYFNGKRIVKKIMYNLLKNGQEENLLKLLVTANNTDADNTDYNYVETLFTQQLNKVNYLKRVKWILLKILYDNEFISLRNNENYLVFDNMEREYCNIAKVVLKIFITSIETCIRNENIRNYPTDINVALNYLFKTYKNSSKKEILFIKEIAQKDALTRFEKIINEFQNKIKDNKVLFYKYNRLLKKLTLENE